MANPQVATFQMTKEGDKYNFQYHDGYYIENISGTTKELALLLFKQLILAPQDGYSWRVRFNSWPPFWIDDQDPDNPVIALECFCKIEPEPSQEFWNEVNRQFQRFMKLIIFS